MKKIYASFLEQDELYYVAKLLVDKLGSLVGQFMLLQIILRRFQNPMNVLSIYFGKSASNAYTF